MPNTSITPTDIASRARQTAAIIRQLPHIIKQLAEANPWPSVAEVRDRLNPTKIEVDFADVALYVGRHWTPAHQDQLVVQIGKVTEGVRAFIEVFEHCKQTKSRETVNFNRHEGAFFLTVCMMVAKEIAQWAQDIERRARETNESRAANAVEQDGTLPNERQRSPVLPAARDARDAKEAIRRLGVEFATVRQLAEVVSLTQGAIRSRIKRAIKKDRNLALFHVKTLPEAGPWTARKTYKIGPFWKHIQPDSERSQEN